MELALNMGTFAPLTFDELMEIDGGKVNWWGIATGVFTVAAGVFALAAAIVDPEPASKTYLIYAGASTVCAGVSSIGWACTS